MNYLGSIEYYRRLLHTGAAFDLSRPYNRQLGINRCLIDSPSGALMLTVPVVNPHGSVPIGEVLISDHGNWRHRHWNALVSSYRQTPYFDYYEDDFRPFFTEHKWERLIDFNIALHDKVMELIGIRDFSVSVLHGSQNSHINKYLNLRDSDLPTYYQVFADRHGFIPNLSIVDLLFNMGPESVYWL